MNKENTKDYYIQALLLSEVIIRILEKKGGIALSRPPGIDLVDVVDFKKRMRVTSIEKFEVTTLISVLNLIREDEKSKKNETVATIVVYIIEDFITTLFRKLGYPEFDEDDESLLENACGTFCNLVGGKFKEGLEQMSYEKLTLTHFLTYQNSVFTGVDYPLKQKKKYVMSFQIKEQKVIMAELVMGAISKVNL